MKLRPVGIDLFAGAGGMSLGFEQAGFDIVAAVEIDPIHCAVHHFNFPETAVIPRSVVGLTGDALRELSGIGNRAVDVVFGGPPCQGFSLIGQRMLDDSRNQLVKEFVRLVSELDAKTFVFENVKGLTVGKHRMFLDALILAFKDVGYRVRVPWRVLNARNFGVPQDRQRLFLFGARKGVPLPDYPEYFCTEGRDLVLEGQGPLPPTCFDAIGDLPDPDRWPELLESDAVLFRNGADPSAYARSLRCADDGAWYFGYVRKWDPDVLTSSARNTYGHFANPLPENSRRADRADLPLLQIAAQRCQQHASGGNGFGERGFHQPAAHPLRPPPMRDGPRDGPPSRLPGLVPVPRDQMARGAPDREPGSAAARPKRGVGGRPGVEDIPGSSQAEP